MSAAKMDTFSRKSESGQPAEAKVVGRQGGLHLGLPVPFLAFFFGGGFPKIDKTENKWGTLTLTSLLKKKKSKKRVPTSSKLSTGKSLMVSARELGRARKPFQPRRAVVKVVKGRGKGTEGLGGTPSPSPLFVSLI